MKRRHDMRMNKTPELPIELWLQIFLHSCDTVQTAPWLPLRFLAISQRWNAQSGCLVRRLLSDWVRDTLPGYTRNWSLLVNRLADHSVSLEQRANHLSHALIRNADNIEVACVLFRTMHPMRTPSLTFYRQVSRLRQTRVIQARFAHNHIPTPVVRLQHIYMLENAGECYRLLDVDGYKALLTSQLTEPIDRLTPLVEVWYEGHVFHAQSLFASLVVSDLTATYTTLFGYVPVEDKVVVYEQGYVAHAPSDVQRVAIHSQLPIAEICDYLNLAWAMQEVQRDAIKLMAVELAASSGIK